MPRRFLSVVCTVLLIAGSVSAADAVGQWKGSIDIPGTPLEVSITIEQGAGGLIGHIDIPAQNAKDLPLKEVKIDGSSVSFMISGIPGDPAFTGTMSDDDATIIGNFSQGGAAFPFTLSRFDEAAAQTEKAAIDKKLDKIRTFIDSTMTYWNVPGMGLGIVMNDSVVLLDGFGYGNLEDSTRVTAHTQFAIGSSTKAFTTMLLGMLVDDGTIEWDEPVRTYLPTFALKDDFASARMTPEDLVTHRSGLPRHDLMWYNSSASREELFKRLKFLEPNEDFRTVFQYQNLMYMTAGYLVGQMTNSTWEEQIKTRIFSPLGMTESNLSINDMYNAPDHALGYRWLDDAFEKMEYRGIEALGPAGSINSSVNDMVKWVQLQLGDGTFNGARLISEEELTNMRVMHMAISSPSPYDEMPVSGYGLGWFIQPYRGHAVAHHGGNIDGFSALVFLMPNDKLGLVILTNVNGTPYTSILARTIADYMLDLEPVGWHDRVKTQREAGEEAEEQKKMTEKVEGTKPSHQLKDYVGTYENPGYGTAEVTMQDKKLTLTYNDIPLNLEHWHYDVFRGTNDLFEDFGFMVTFRLNERGDIASFIAPLELSVDDIEFTRQPSAEWKKPEYLSRFTGKYELSGQTITFSIRGDNTLIATIPGQPTFELEAFEDNEFSLAGLTGFSVKFIEIKNEQAQKVEFHQPNGVFTAERFTDED